MRTVLISFFLLGGFSTVGHPTPASPKPKNKLVRMYQLFYLPFRIDFRQGRSIDEVLPYTWAADPKKAQMLTADQLAAVDARWNGLRTEWKKKSLLLKTPVQTGETAKLTETLFSHVLPLSFSVLDRIPLEERIALNRAANKFSEEAQAAFKQERFLKSLLAPDDKRPFHFFIISPSWCESSREYRLVLENYFRRLKNSSAVMHSIVIEDPKKNIFESKLMKEVFPFPSHYSHLTVPRFLALDLSTATPQVLEEAEALDALEERYLKSMRGYLE